LKKILLLFFCCFTSVAFSQLQKQISFNQLTVNEGLSQNSVVSIAQDSIGYLWFATQDGLNKYDWLIGIKKAIKNIPDLIISDIMMPNKDGIALCETLKQDPRTSHIPIIFLTAKSGNSNELNGLKNKADDYIMKPFNAEIVKQKVINLILSRKELQKKYSQYVYLYPKDIAVTNIDEEFLENVQKVIDSKLMKADFSAKYFSRELALSRMQLHRKLKALTGLSTTEFIRF